MAILVKGQDFADGEQITATKLDNLVDNATFAAGAVETGGGVQLNGSGQLKVAGNIDIGSSNLTATGTISLGTTSFNDNDITNVGSIALDTITNDGTDVTIDSSGDIILDADGAQIRIKDAGTERFIFNTDATPELDVLGGDFTIHANTSDADIIFTGNDGGSTITALTLDMSAAGAATFNDKITAVGTSVFTNLDISGDVDVDGTINLDAVDIDGNVQIDGTVTVGVDDTGHDVKFFGDTSGAYIQFDASADKLLTAGGATVDIVKDKLLIGGTAVTTTAAELNVLDGVTAGTVTASKGIVVDSNKDIASFRNITLTGELDAGSLDVSGDIDVDGTTNLDAVDIDGAVQLDSTLTVGVNDTGYDVKFFGATSGAYMLWDESQDDLILGGAARIGIGTASPAVALDVVGAGTITAGLNIGIDNTTAGSINVFGGVNSAAEGGEIRLYNHADADGSYDFWRLDSDTNGFFRIGRAGQTDLTIDHDGYVGIGTTNADKALVVAGVGAEIVINDTDTTDTPRLRFRESGSTSASISTDASELIFDTGTTERVRIDASGNVGINDSTPSYKLDVNGTARVTGNATFDGTINQNISGTASYFPGYHKDTFGAQLEDAGANGSTLYLGRDNQYSLALGTSVGTSSTDEVAVFHNTDGNVGGSPVVSTKVGNITITTSTVALNSTSDYRAKENVVDLTDGISRLKELKPYRFNFIRDPNTIVDGFFAHEVSPFVPEAVCGEKDAVDEDGKPEYQGIDQSKLVPLLTAALQEAVAKIEALEARVVALEG